MFPSDLQRRSIVTRGEALYEAAIRNLVEPEHTGKFLVMDVVSGEFEIDANVLHALDRLRTRKPGAEPYALRVGFPTAVTLGGSRIGAA